ncbi:transposase [uncultured Marinococcus sp.]|jgi:REP element-mobilizing transposase RayT|uniref:transposase n=1 Tax=uncultured Marinococcus sp. TaxID=487012 RepID=UPI0026070476|nr:transposase [uncultured Marinococcus sp.]
MPVPRDERLWFPGTVYSITAAGASGRTLFPDEKDYKQYVYLLAKVINTTKLDLHAYCLLPDSIHLLAESTYVSISTIMRELHASYAMHYRRHYETGGSVFQARYHSELLPDETSFFEQSRRIHLLPSEKLDHPYPGTYRWCSARDYLAPQPEYAPRHPFLSLERTLAFFPSPRHEYFHRFLYHTSVTQTH